jgi:hypothetical protein
MEKKLIPWIMLVLPTGLMAVLTTCSSPGETYQDKGSKAAIEFCKCFRENTKDECLEELKDQYESYVYMSDNFIDSFNDTNTCGITLYKETTTSSSPGTAYKLLIYP